MKIFISKISIYFLLTLNAALEAKILFNLYKCIVSYDRSNLKNVGKLYVRFSQAKSHIWMQINPSPLKTSYKSYNNYVCSFLEHTMNAPLVSDNIKTLYHYITEFMSQ